MTNSALFKRSSELKWILSIISFQSFIDLIFIELEANICLSVFVVLRKYCCDALLLRLFCCLNDWMNWSNASGSFLVNLSKTNKQLLNMVLFFNLFFNYYLTVTLTPNLTCVSYKWVKEWILNCFENVSRYIMS